MVNLSLVKRWWKCAVSHFHTLWYLTCLMCVLLKPRRYVTCCTEQELSLLQVYF